MCRVFFIAGLLVLLTSNTRAHIPSISVLDLGATPFAQKTTEQLRERLRSKNELQVADADLSRAAAKGIGYSGSLNLTVSEARDLGAALATDFYVIGDAQTLRRSSSARPVYYESYCSLFVVSARTGRLILWDRPSFEADTPSDAEERLAKELAIETIYRTLLAIRRAREDEQSQRTIVAANSEPLIEEAPEDEKAAEIQGVRLPRPYVRMRPEYPESAARAEAEGTVDVLVDVHTNGKVGEVQIVRWAGFGLDQATVATVRQMQFFPAMKNGSPIPMRVLLRYNFRKPPR
jgi:TonB family protein